MRSMLSLNIRAIVNLGMAVMLAMLLFNTCTPALAQQHVIANKDVTRPEIQEVTSKPAAINLLTAVKRNGYHEISWTSRNDQDVQVFIVEYSTDGVIYQSAGQVSVHSGLDYVYQHYIMDDRPILYRINMLLKNNRNVFAGVALLEGIPVSPVTFYPTVVTGNTININSTLPLERMTIVSTGGSQVFARDLNGQSNYMPVVIPGLAQGMYIITFYGKGWHHSEKMMVSAS